MTGQNRDAALGYVRRGAAHGGGKAPDRIPATDSATTDDCPMCGYPKAQHTYFSRTSCVIASMPDDPDDRDETIEVNDGFGI